jgi:hypothetical protein
MNDRHSQRDPEVRFGVSNNHVGADCQSRKRAPPGEKEGPVSQALKVLPLLLALRRALAAQNKF